jgi:hypothetical protein
MKAVKEKQNSKQVNQPQKTKLEHPMVKAKEFQTIKEAALVKTQITMTLSEKKRKHKELVTIEKATHSPQAKKPKKDSNEHFLDLRQQNRNRDYYP